jgi:hypothetical protein
MRNAVRVHGFNVSVPSKVPVVECENTLYAMYPHCRHEAGIVNLHARDAMGYEKLAPLFVNCKAVREQAELFLEGLCKPVCLQRREAVAIAINWASTGIPKFVDILGGVTQNAIMPKNGIRG